MPIIRFIGSLYFAIFLITSLAVILTVSTLMEFIHGTPFAQKIFYQAGWFDIFLSFLALNIFASAALRFPFKKHHIGFLVTHGGILLLLAGALLSRSLGIEGRMALFEGEHSDLILQEAYQLKAVLGDREPLGLDLRGVEETQSYSLFLTKDELKVHLHEAFEDAVPYLAVKEDPQRTRENRAVKFTLESQKLGFNKSFWLIEHDPQNPHSRFASVGPALVELVTEKTRVRAGQPILRLTRKPSEDHAEIVLSEKTQAGIPVFDNTLKITQIRYLAHAKVVENKLVDAPEEVPFNPAVEFEIEDFQGHAEKHTKFALFPHFDSLHGRSYEDLFGLKVELEVPLPDLSTMGYPSSFKIMARPDGQWSYRMAASSAKEEVRKGTIEKNKSIETGWMDWRLEVRELLTHALISKTARKADRSETGVAAAQISVSYQNKNSERKWVFAGAPASFATHLGQLEISAEQKSRKLPFILFLKDFRKIDYPGTQKALSFESDVVVHDPGRKAWSEKTIRMNEPLDYGGFRIFQSSYFQEPSGAEGSVFTIARNPGIYLIYGGACLIFAGIVLLFYLPSLLKERR